MLVPSLALAGTLALRDVSPASVSRSDVFCPVLCESVGYDSQSWTRYTSMQDLLACNRKPRLLDFTIHNDLDQDETLFVVRACTSLRGSDASEEQSSVSDKLDSDPDLNSVSVELDLVYSGSDKSTVSQKVFDQKAAAISEIQAALLSRNQTGNDNAAPASHIVQYGDAVVGVFVGAGIDPRGLATPLQDLSESSLNTIAIQMCGKPLTADHTMGLISDTTPDGKAIFRVQAAMLAWSDAQCVKDLGDTKPFGNSTIWLTKDLEKAFYLDGSVSNSTVASNSTDTDTDSARVSAQAECTTRQVISGDSCASLATKCKITAANLAKYNPSKTFCSTLAVGQYICCSSGTLPDKRPKPNADGSCASLVIHSGDSCSAIGAKYGLTIKELESMNQKTWGWSGCDHLLVGINACLSSGTPALPASVADAECGPQKPGTKKPAAGTDLATLNQCPLKACCNVWGHCGTTTDFCTKASLGPPGTTQPGKNSCISNCGTDIVNNGSPPSSFKKLGYFEAWNVEERPCLRMDVTKVPSDLTHLHFAFGDIGPGFRVSVAKARDQFDKFVKMTGVKRIIAFGGWTASTDPSSYWIFREGVKAANRETLATNLANFVIDNKLDGLDVDWEYPGAPDLPGIPAADPIDGQAYLELLKLLKAKLGSRTLSIAAPASFWYLKQFPMGEIGKVVDYVVYMTYDLHGQWDWDSEWASPGCTKGNCMRSHVNITETKNSLSMITKSGVSSTKIVVGVTSYGRSFRMADPSCSGVQCAFTGPESGAKPGRCTDTRGYISNAEIKEIIAKDSTASVAYDSASMSNILRYGPQSSRNWVAYMDDKNKAERIALWKGLNFGGTSDWAVDLDSFLPGDDTDPGHGPIFIEQPTGFQKLECNNRYYLNATLDPEDRWKELKVNEAWDYAISKWTLRDKKFAIQEFVPFISNELVGPEDMDCQNLAAKNGCDGPIDCDDSISRTPGATLLLRSFTQLNEMAINFYDGILDAHSNLETNLSSFAGDFAPVEEPDEGLSWLLDFLGVGFGLAAGPIFQKAFATSRFFLDKADALEKLQETVMAGVDYGLGAAKDAMVTDPGEDATKDLATALLQFTIQWQTFVTETQEDAFKGDESSLKYLKEMIDQGKAISLTARKSLDSQNDVLQILYSYLIPYAWSLRGFSPVLVKTGWGCDEEGGEYDYEGLDPEDDDMAGICVDGVKYFLMHVEGKAIECKGADSGSHWGQNDCVAHKMSVLPGMEALGATEGSPDTKDTDDFEGYYGSITRKVLAKSIISRNKNRGNSGLAHPVALSTDGDRENFWDFLEGDGVRIMEGMVRIPMCDVEEAYENWSRTSAGDEGTWPSYPCDREPADILDLIPWPGTLVPTAG